MSTAKGAVLWPLVFLSLSCQDPAGVAEATHGSEHWLLGKHPQEERGCRNSFFFDSLFVHLASVNRRAKLTAKVVYYFLWCCFCKHGESYYKPSKPSQDRTHTHILYRLHTPGQYFPCPQSTQGQVPGIKGQPLHPKSCWNYLNLELIG